jgi:ParB-like chromosome segregation protein Spo0J
MPAIEQTAQTTDAPTEAASAPRPASQVPVEQLTGHPGNVRDGLDLSTEFCASVAEAGVRVPLLITTASEGGGFRVIEGHRRLAAAVKAGLAEVPCVLDTDRAEDEAGQYLDMVLANSGSHRRNFTPIEEAAALFAAHEAGASRTRIRKSTGRKADEIRTALQAGRVSASAREQAGELVSQLSLADLALLAEFDGDDDATGQILEALSRGYTAEYVAERIRQDRAEAAEHDRMVAEFEAAGTLVTSDLPARAVRLSSLDHGGEELTPETHASCPGRGVFFPSWSRVQPVHYCASPAEHGHTDRYASLTSGGDDSGNATSQAPQADGTPQVGGREDEGFDPSRRLVIEGNKAWAAAAEVRKRWLQQLFARRAAPKEVARFVAGQLLTMPEPLRLGLANAHSRAAFPEIVGHPDQRARAEVDTCTAVRLPLLMLAPIAVAYESEMYGTDAGRRATWRQDRYSPCSRTEAGRYLSFLASLGYQLSPIEQAVADGEAYTGDSLGDTLTDESGGGCGNSDTDTSDTGGASADDAPTEVSEASDGESHAGTDQAASDDGEMPVESGEVAEG